MVAGAGAALFGLDVRVEVEVHQRVDLGRHFEHDVAAVPSVAAVGPAEGLELFAQDGTAAVAAVARLQVQDDAIDEP